MVGRPELAQSGQLTHGQRLDAGILDQGDERDLERLQGTDGKAWSAVHQVRLGVRGGCSI